MPLLVILSHLSQDSLDILVGRFHRSIHLRSVGSRSHMTNLIGFAHLINCFVVQIGSIICDDAFWLTISANDLIFQEAGYCFTRNTCIRSCFNPFSKVIDSHKNVLMSIRRFWVDRPDHVNTPHGEWPGRRHIL